MKEPTKKAVKKPSAKRVIDENTTLSAIYRIPGAGAALEANHVPCVHCPMAMQELGSLTIAYVCEAYSLDKKKLIKELKEL